MGSGKIALLHLLHLRSWYERLQVAYSCFQETESQLPRVGAYRKSSKGRIFVQELFVQAASLLMNIFREAKADTSGRGKQSFGFENWEFYCLSWHEQQSSVEVHGAVPGKASLSSGPWTCSQGAFLIPGALKVCDKASAKPVTPSGSLKKLVTSKKLWASYYILSFLSLLPSFCIFLSTKPY